MYRPIIGDVVKYNDREMVVVDMKNYENSGSCSYDRKYLLCELDYINTVQGVVTSHLEQHGMWLTVRGIEFPYIEKVDVPSFAIESVECKMIKQTIVKTTIQ